MIQSLFALFFFALLLGFPIIMGYLLLTNFDKLEDEKFLETFGEFYRELNLANGKVVLWQPLWFLFRRLMLAIMVVYFDGAVIWQISLMAFQVIVAVIVYGNVEPFKDRHVNKFEIFNEVTVMFVMYNIMCFTPFVPDVEVRYKLGFVVCALITFNILVNLSRMVKPALRSIWYDYKIRKAKKEYKTYRVEFKKKLDERKHIR